MHLIKVKFCVLKTVILYDRKVIPSLFRESLYAKVEIWLTAASLGTNPN